jgi:hypothetical protein
MPDRWGRVTHNDWNAMTGMINNIQAMGQRNQLYRQNQDEYQRQKTFREQRDQVANAYLNSAQVPNQNVAGPDPRMPVPTQAQDPEKAIAAMGDVSPGAKVAGQTLAAQSKQADVSLMSSEDAKQFQQKENDIVSWISQNGIDSIDKIPPELTAGVPGQKALVSALEREAAKAENKQKLFERRMDFLTPKYQIFSLQSDAVNKALLEGREDDVVMGLRQMVKDLPIPYQLGEFNPEDRSFDVKYFDRRTGKLQSVEKKPLTEVIAEMNATGKEKYFNQALLHMEAKRLENLEAEKNPLPGKTKGGTPVLITPQVPVQEPDGNLNIRVKDEKTGELLAEYKSWEALYDSGTSVENLDREYKKQQIATSEAAMGSHNRANQQDTVKALEAQLDFYSKRMKTTLEPFKEGSGNLGFSFDANGALVMDENGEGLYGKSQAFLAEHEGKQDSLSPEDQVKYAAAVSARQDMQAMIALGRQPQAMGNERQGTSGQEDQAEIDFNKTYTAEEARQIGARKGKDGNWYYPIGNGEYQPLRVSGGTAETSQPKNTQMPLDQMIGEENAQKFQRQFDGAESTKSRTGLDAQIDKYYDIPTLETELQALGYDPKVAEQIRQKYPDKTDAELIEMLKKEQQ